MIEMTYDLSERTPDPQPPHSNDDELIDAY